MSKHTITTSVPVHFRITDMPMDEHETAWPRMEVTYSYIPGSPDTGPTYASGGQPAEPAEVDVILAKVIDGDGLDIAPDDAANYAQEYVNDDDGAFAEFCEHAEYDRCPDPDAMRDAEIDDRLTDQHLWSGLMEH